MIENVKTGDLIVTEVQPVDAGDLFGLRPGWKFDWFAEVKKVEVFKLVDPDSPGVILGLLALKRCPNYVEVTLLESSPENVGHRKNFDGIAGSLLAYAAQISFSLGGDGYVAIDVKTELFEHYSRRYGFQRLGNSFRMALSTRAAGKLISNFVGRPPHG